MKKKSLVKICRIKPGSSGWRAESPAGTGGCAGFSLIELLVSLAVSAIITGILFTLCIHVQRLSVEIVTSIDGKDSLRLAPLVLGNWIKGAGMNLKHVPGGYLEVGVDSIAVKSDIDGAGGVPDGDIDDSFEDISIKVNRNELKLKSGSGSYQPVLRNLTSMAVEQVDSSLLEFHLNGRQNPMSSNDSTQAKTCFCLWNPRSNLFPEVMP